MSTRYAHIIPVMRTPFGVNGFDYLIPPDMSGVLVGSLVLIPFRRSQLVGVVSSITTESAFAGKAKSLIGPYIDLVFPQKALNLLTWTAKRTFSSEPTVLAAWLRQLPKRPSLSRSAHKDSRKHNPAALHLEAEWTQQPQDMLLKRATEALRRGQHVLIITPWLSRTTHLHTRLPTSTTLHSQLSHGEAFRAWSGFMDRSISCVVTTRLGAWLAPWADLVLIDEPENDDHKQDELAPRYDARLMSVWCAKNAHIAVESVGLTPPIHVETTAPDIAVDLTIHPRRPGGFSPIPCIQANSLAALRDHEGPRIVVHPIRGVAARLVCRECGWRATCSACQFELSAELHQARCRQCQKTAPLPETCGVCGGVDLGKSTPGIERLKSAWQKHEPETAVSWRNIGNEDMDAPIPSGAIVLITDAPLLGGGAEDVRRRERTCVAFRRLADRVATAGGRLIIQCPESLDPITHHPETPGYWREWLTSDGFTAFRLRERQDRLLFHYPPHARLVKCLIDDTEEAAVKWGKAVADALPKDVSMQGPFLVAHRPISRSQRFVWHLIFPADVSEERLLQSLHPFASSAIIDLDPIAYFK